MRIYCKCPCCGRTIFLVMEMELGSNYDLNYKNEPSNDWNCFNGFLECLQNSQGQRVYLSLSEKEQNKLPEEFKELIFKWKEGYVKPKAKTEPQANNPGETPHQGNPSPNIPTPPSNPPNQPEPQPTNLPNSTKLTRWKNINHEFTEELINQWERQGFAYEQTQDWANAFGPQSFHPQEVDFIAWLRDFKRTTPEWMLNYGNLTELKEEYENK